MEGNALVQFLPLILIILLFYLILIRPQQKRRRQMMELQSRLHRGQRVMTNSLMYANVAAVDDDQVVLEIAPGVECRYSKSAVVQVFGSADSDETGEKDTTPPA